jgi:hypothetical protein
MLIHAVVHNRRILGCTLGALLLVAAERSAFGQDLSSASGNSAAPADNSTAPADNGAAPADNSAAPADAQSSRTPSPPAAETALPEGFFPEPRLITRAIDYVTNRYGDGSSQMKSGFYPELSNMISGSGWVSAGPGYRKYFADDQVFIDGSAAVSWHLYKMVQGRFELPTLASNHLVIGAQGMWQDATQVNYFGIGPDSLEANRSQYRMQTTDVVGYAIMKPYTWLSIGIESGFLKQPKVMAPGGTFMPDFPETRNLFPADPGVSLTSQPNFWHNEGSVTADTLDHHSYPSTGGLYRGAFTSYDAGGNGTFSFDQYEAEGEQFIPLADRRVVLGFRGWTLYSDVPAGHQIPFYLLPSLGGNNTLRDFLSYRFHDNNLLVLNAESRFLLYRHLDLALFADAGNVAPAFDELNLKKTSYGAGVRLHTDTVSIGRFDVAYGSEGWQFVFRTSDPFRLSREKRRVAAVPFMP